jgi:hypothetical protein
MALRIKDWNKFQHFKDRKPPWIKLYRDILDDPDWHELDGDTAKMLVSIWLIASEDETQQGYLPDTRRLAFRLRITETKLKQSLTKLSHWLYQDDINVISDCYQVDIPETETETEKERETKKEKETDLRKPERSAVPYSEIVDLYHQKLPMLAQVYKMTTLRKNKVKLLWHEELQSLNAWENYFDFISQSAFLTGKTIGKDGRAFIADFDFIVNQTNFVKIAEEKYHGKKV